MSVSYEKIKFNLEFTNTLFDYRSVAMPVSDPGLLDTEAARLAVEAGDASPLFDDWGPGTERTPGDEDADFRRSVFQRLRDGMMNAAMADANAMILRTWGGP